MSEPLIDRDDLEDAIYLAFNLRVNTADAVIAYLREVLTPEALATVELRPSDLAGVSYGERSTGADLHRRIFGDT